MRSRKHEPLPEPSDGPSCALPTCTRSRQPGSDFCDRHGPKIRKGTPKTLERTASPERRAAIAYERGDMFFQAEIDIDKLSATTAAFWGIRESTIKERSALRKPAPDILGQIEEVGWRLEHVGYVFVETGATSSKRIGAIGTGTVTRGVVRGIYLFRRDEQRRRATATIATQEPRSS